MLGPVTHERLADRPVLAELVGLAQQRGGEPALSDDGTAIALPPDQTAEPLLEAQHRLGKGQLSERVRQHRAPGSLQRVARDPER